MKYLLLTFMSFLMPLLAFSQVMDDSNIRQLEQGDYNLEKGKVQVIFTDTVSAGFIEMKMEELGFQIISSNFQNIILSVENNPKPGQLSEIEESKWVDFIMSEAAGIKDEDIKEMSRKDTLDDNKINNMLTKLNQSGDYEFIIIALTYNATEEQAKELMEKYPDLNIQVSETSQRTAILKTDIDKELEAMDELEKLPFVKNTAFLGSLEQ